MAGSGGETKTMMGEVWVMLHSTPARCEAACFGRLV